MSDISNNQLENNEIEGVKEENSVLSNIPVENNTSQPTPQENNEEGTENDSNVSSNTTEEEKLEEAEENSSTSQIAHSTSEELEEGEILEEGEEEQQDEEVEADDDRDTDNLAGQKKKYDISYLRSFQFQKSCQEFPSMLEKDKNQIILREFQNAMAKVASNIPSNTPQNKKQMRKGKGKGQGYNNIGKTNSAPNIPRKINSNNPNAWVVPDRNTETEEGRRAEFNRQVNGMLNKLTLENFDSLNTKLIDLIMGAREYLTDVINSIFDKALAEPKFSMVYSKLCQSIYQKLDKSSTLNNEPINFRVMLVNKCQEQFNNRFTDQDLNEEEYARNKQRYLGNIKFIGELFLSKLLPYRVIILSANMLINGNGKEVDEEDLESLCKLLTTTGKILEQQLNNIKPQKDGPPPIQQLDSLFENLHTISTVASVSNRIKYMILDLEELRGSQWVPRRKFEGPMKIAEVRREVKKMEKDIKKIEKDIKKFDSEKSRGSKSSPSHSVPSSPRRSSNPLNNSGDTHDNVPLARGGKGNKDSNNWVVKGRGGGKANPSLASANSNQGWKVKSDTNVKNHFASLETLEKLEKPRKEVSFAKSKVKATTASFTTIVDEYFNSEDDIELKDSLVDMDAKDSHHLFIICLIQRTTKKDRISKSAKLVKYLFDEHLLLPEHLNTALAEVLKGMEETKEDFPNAPAFLGEFAAQLFSLQIFSPSSFASLFDNEEDLNKQDQSKILLTFLKTALSTSSVDDLVEKIKAENFNIFKYVLADKLESEADLADLTKRLRE